MKKILIDENGDYGLECTNAVWASDQMLMYGKEARNQKQEIDRQHHTIPNKKGNP